MDSSETKIAPGYNEPSTCYSVIFISQSDNDLICLFVFCYRSKLSPISSDPSRSKLTKLLCSWDIAIHEHRQPPPDSSPRKHAHLISLVT